MSNLNPWKIIEGKYPAYAELKDFTEERWMSILRFFDFFIESHENSETVRINSKKIEEMEAFLNIDNHPNHEWLYRMGQWKGKTTPQKYKFKLNGMKMHCLGFIKKHPGVVTEQMKSLIMSHPQQMAWCLDQFKVKELLTGQEIVARDNTVKNDVYTKQTSLPSVQAKIMSATVKMADIAETLADSISSTQLKSMDIEDKLKHLEKILPILGSINKAKMTGNSFTQINLNGGVADIEKSMLDYVNKTNQ